MESLFSREKMNRCKKKVIPWHVQKSFSQFSLNQTISTALYRKKIKSLQKNNRHLASALQQSRYLATEKENLLIDNGKILNIINFSRVKLTDMAMNMKQATECLDETLSLLNSSLNDSLSKHSPKNQNYRADFKNKLQELSRNSPINEESENSESPGANIQSYAQKGKISRVDDCASSPNKKCKFTKRGRRKKQSSKDVPKSAGGSSPVTPTTPKNTTIKIIKKYDSALNINSQKRKISLPKISNIESASSSKISKSTSSKCLLQTKTKQESLDKKHKAATVILTDIAEAFLNLETENNHSPITNGPTSASPKPNFKHFTSNSPEDDVLIKNYFSSKVCKQKNSAMNSYSSQFATINDDGMLDNSANTSDSSSNDLPEIEEKSPCQSPILSPLLLKENFIYDQNDVKLDLVVKNKNITQQNSGSCIKKTDSEKDKKTTKSHNLKVKKRVSFYYDEDAIEKVEGNAVASKDRIRKTINKCKARKTVSHKKKNIPSEGTSLTSNLTLPDNISKLGKNSFLVAAEVHSPPNGIYAQEIKKKICASENMEPCVVLTDIFKSNKELLSEMVGNGLRENGCLEKTVTKPIETPLVEMSGTTCFVNKNAYNVYDSYAGHENTVGEDCLLEDRSLRKKIFCQEGIAESKTVCKKPLVVLRDVINSRNILIKCREIYSNEKSDINSVPYLLDEKENRLPEDREIIEQGKQRRRSKIVSYKEPPLNIKMRRLF